MDGYKTYIYEGPVMEFDRCVCNNWHGETSAPTPAKAKSNLSYQFKKQYKLERNVRVTLPGTLRAIN